MRYFVVTNGFVTKVTELLISDKSALLEPGFRITRDANGYADFNSAFVSMIALEMMALP